MKYLVAAFAIAAATPAAAQQASHQGHGQHQQGGQSQHQGHGSGQHQGHGSGQHQGHGQQGQHQGHGESCPCCARGPNGQRPPCCEGMQQRGAQGAQPTGGHDNH